jgi:leader peptidase (prepilin peptidase)/N-methyltransferase
MLTGLLGWQLLLLAVVDGENFWLPDILTWPLAVSGLLAAIILPDRGFVDAVIGAVAGFATLWLLGFAYRKTRGRQGLGGGDPFMLAGAGAWVGWIGLPSVLLWAALGGLSLVIARAVTGRKVTGADRLPFGVFLAIGTWLTWMLGPIGLWR